MWLLGFPNSCPFLLWDRVQPLLQDAIDESNGETDISITYNELKKGVHSCCYLQRQGDLWCSKFKKERF